MLAKALYTTPLFSRVEIELILDAAIPKLTEVDEKVSLEDLLNCIVTEAENHFYTAVQVAVKQECIAYSYNG